MSRTPRWISTLTLVALVAGALVAFADEAQTPQPASGAADDPVVLASAAEELEEGNSRSNAKLVNVRAGLGKNNATRIVAQLDRSAEFLTMELADRPGYEIRLLGTTSAGLPEPLEVNDGRVTRVTFAEGPSGVVVRIETESNAIQCRSFPLNDPPRLVFDLAPQAKAATPKEEIAPHGSAPADAPQKPDLQGDAPKSAPGLHSDAKKPAPSLHGDSHDTTTKKKTPAPEADEHVATAPKSPKLVDKAKDTSHDVKKKALSPVASESTPKKSMLGNASPNDAHPEAKHAEPAEHASLHDVPATAEKAAHGAHADSTPGEKAVDPKFDELLDWLEQFKKHAEAIGPESSESEKVKHWRKIASLFARRGLYSEADETLTRALNSPAPDTSQAFADSLRLAEIRQRAGKTKDALFVAQRLSHFGRSNDEKVRLAKLHGACGSPIPARNILEEALPKLDSKLRVEALEILARAYWDSSVPDRAYETVVDLLDEPNLKPAIEANALLIRADCLFSFGRYAEARADYEHVTSLDLSGEEAAWTRLQLGNVAHREGRLEDAKSHYREAVKSWPETFYASQAAWFLQTTERMEAAESKKEKADRG